MLRVLGLAGMLMSFNIHAAMISPVSGVKILFANGTEVDEPLEPMEVDAKSAQLVVRYAAELGSGSNQKVFDSAPFVITINDLGEDIKLYPPKVFSYEQANREFNSSPKWRIEGVSGKEISYSQEKLKGNDGFMPYYGMEALIVKHNEERGIVFSAGVVKAEVATTDKMVEKPATTNNADALVQLQHWYKQASTEERKAFRKWMVDQE
ncbi:TPA: DUF2057 domain-containing protein [Vibrio vulnificus]|uniref:YccT family protein n=1 Tax=Vibrio vulnificus TaxID=672 RepID=UPI00165DF65E|nr:DUF2057 domain-containing protein [Vibrio vulnificus]EGR9006657.1 DUF2057 domain-containing protein [Vibrio vulnificus]EHU9456810.1 DUF2057 domain-containing protein [Vibrio vulnificus]ELY5142065.1 DUF2057 domain-containing protein [Vibrio vulnificus]NTJ40965.1 DUF2057 domain-containing protein [Vibrio vulnificus]WIL73354.1 DUF2057 domain-containing protein [Vibrio vulnificus]